MKRSLILSLFVMFFLALTQAEATPVFAKQYGQKCATCHSMMPTLNKTGLQFLRNGFRFSKDDTTVLAQFLDANSSGDRLFPAHALLGVNIDTKTRQDVEKVNMYFGGAMTDTISAYAVTRSTFNKKRNHELFGETNSRGFLQWNPLGNQHVLKVGYMAPLTMFLNADRLLMDNGLMGSALVKKAPKNKKKPSWAKKKPLPAVPGENATPQQKKKYAMMKMPKEPYKMAGPKANMGLVKGLEYSYLYDDTALFLVNVGIPTSPFFATDDDLQTTAGVQFRDIGDGYNFGFIYSHQELGNIKTDSYMIPFEKDFFDGQLTYAANLVYTDSDRYFNPYFGFDNTFVYQVSDDIQVRAIASFDKDEDENSNSGYTLTYSRSWEDKYLMHLSGGTMRTTVFDESIAKLSLYMFL